MKTVIIAPHPDDEWIGCGCTILKKLDSKEKIKVLIITRVPRTERRINASKMLAKKYSFELKILGMPELKVDYDMLCRFLMKNVDKNDVVYIPDFDAHIDHRTANRATKKVLKHNRIYEYAVYNNSLNPFIRIKNRFLFSFLRRGFPSFKKGKKGRFLKHKTNIKDRITKEYFYEMPRGADVLRKVN